MRKKGKGGDPVVTQARQEGGRHGVWGRSGQKNRFLAGPGMGRLAAVLGAGRILIGSEGQDSTPPPQNAPQGTRGACGASRFQVVFRPACLHAYTACDPAVGSPTIGEGAGGGWAFCSPSAAPGIRISSVRTAFFGGRIIGEPGRRGRHAKSAIADRMDRSVR